MPDDSLAYCEPKNSSLADPGALLQAQKTELVAQLAGAMSNQFNNIMMAITGYAELELKKASPQQKRSLEQILSNSARATKLIQKLLAFSRKQTPAPRKLAFNATVEDISQLLQPLVGEEINVTVNLDQAVGSVVADPIEIEQLVLSLGLNARDAMSSGGTLEVRTELLDLDPESFGKDELPEAGRFAMLSVQYASTGGKQEERLQPAGNQDLRIAQAIAAVRGLVKERRGLFRASARPGQSTTFRVYFPALAAAPPSLHAESISVDTAASTKTILIVEDDDAVRNPAAEFLKMEGFKVLQARAGTEALRIVQESRSHVDLLVTDIVMAGMHGNEVAEELYKTHPALKVLYMSGDADKVAKVGKSGSTRPRAVLQKPFRLNKLNDKIREILGE
jgi:two-component system cell cycle sensor histidine kinase/response regulator CckA